MEGEQERFQLLDDEDISMMFLLIIWLLLI